MGHPVGVKRVYEAPAPQDGRRVLVDRLWPRGLTKAKAHVDEWLRDVAPSDELRRWFAHDPARWQDFRVRYGKELKDNPAFARLEELAAEGPITLLYAARDEMRNNAVVLAERLRGG